jgi:hypothetical protein
MTAAAAQRFLDKWGPWLNAFLIDLQFLERVDVCIIRNGKALKLAGPSIEAKDFELTSTLKESLTTRDGRAVLLNGAEWLDLWPLCGYGRAARRTLHGQWEASSDSPLIYYRCASDRLLYMALGVDLPNGEDRDVVREFRELFKLETALPRDAQTSDFEKEVKIDAQRMIGRQTELRMAKEAIKNGDTGVFWIGGPGGIGKSLFMARLADDFLGFGPRLCRIVWRFRIGDALRCNRIAFFRHAIERLTEWLHREHVSPEQEPLKLESQLATLLGEAGRLSAGAPQRSPSRVVFLLDGLDEIESMDPEFGRIAFRLNGRNVVWVCAGRLERTLLEVFAPERCTHIFPQGLPRVSDEDIRAMLLDTGSPSTTYCV